MVPAYPGYSATSEPAWSPDGTRIAYKGQEHTLVAKQVVDPATGAIIDGPAITVIATAAGFTNTSTCLGIEDPDWSRNGDRIAFRGCGTTLADSIYVVDAVENGRFAAVPSTAGDSSPTWSSDDSATLADETDRFLLYSEQLKPAKWGSSIVRQELTTGTETVLVAAPKGGSLSFPDWRPFPSSGWAPTGTASPASADSAAELTTGSATEGVLLLSTKMLNGNASPSSPQAVGNRPASVLPDQPAALVPAMDADPATLSRLPGSRLSSGTPLPSAAAVDQALIDLGSAGIGGLTLLDDAIVSDLALALIR